MARPCWSCVPEKILGPAGCGRQMIQSIQQGLLAEGIKVPLTKLCAWFGVPRRTVYYRPTKEDPKVDPHFAEPIKAMIEHRGGSENSPGDCFPAKTVLRLQDRSLAARLQQKHGSAGLSAQGLAGPQASRWHPPPYRGGSVRGQSPERTLVD